MADRSDRSRITVPPGFRELLGALCREILRHQPKNIIEFSAQYFEQKLRERDCETRPLLRSSTSRDLIQEALQSGQITAEIEDKAASKIQAAFRGHAAREQMKQTDDDNEGNKSVNPVEEANKEFFTAICFPTCQKRTDLKIQPAPTPHFDEEPSVKIRQSEAKLVLLDNDTAHIVPILDSTTVTESIESALIACKLRELTSTIYVQSPLGAVAIRPSKIPRSLPYIQDTSRTQQIKPAVSPQHLPPLPRLLLLHPDGAVTTLKVIDRDQCTVIVVEDKQSVAPCSEYLVVPLSGPEVSSAESDSRAEPRPHAYLSSVPSPASLSQYISLRLQRHIGPTGSFHRRSLAALRTLAVHPSLSNAIPKAETSVSSESSFIIRDSRSFALPPPPPNTPVPSLAELESSTLLAAGTESENEFVSATSVGSFVIPPVPPNTPASSMKSSGTSSVAGVDSQRTTLSIMSGYLSDSRIEAEVVDMGASLGRDTLSAPDVTYPVEPKSTKSSSPRPAQIDK